MILRFSASSDSFEYLGYSFSKILNSAGNGEALEIGIAIAKKRKIKRRIIEALLAYGKDKRFELLEERIRFLSETYPIYQIGAKVGILKGGPRFSYKHITQLRDLAELDDFKSKMLFARTGRIARLSVRHLSLAQRKKLASISFVSAFELTRFNKFSAQKTSEITAAFS